MRFVVAAGMIACWTLLAACGSTNGSTATPRPSTVNASVETPTKAAATSTRAPAATATATEPPATPTAGVTPPAAPQPENTPQPATPTEEAEPAPPPAPSGTITLIAMNVQFKASSLSAPPGPVTVTLDNQDRAIAHNVHFFAKAGGQSIGATEVEPGPSTESISLGTLEPGMYPYTCDVHPTTMTGILTVS